MHTVMESRQGSETGERKRTARLRVSGDGGGGFRIEGVLVWGGTLAIASLMALFTIRSKKRVSSRCPCGPEKLKVKATEEGEGDGKENGGLRVILPDQNSPTSPLTPRNSSCCISRSDGGSSRMDLAHLQCCDSALGLSEVKPDIEKDEVKEPHRETVFSDGAKQESVASFSDFSMVEDDLPPATRDPALATNDWNEDTEKHLEKQIFHTSSEGDAFDHAANEELMAEEDELAHPVEEQEGEGEANGGLCVVLPEQSSPTSPLTLHNSSCCIGRSDGGSSRTDLAHLHCCDSASGQSGTSEEKPDIEKDEGKEPHQETVFSDGAKTESVVSFSDYSMVEDGTPPATQDPTLATDDCNEDTKNHLEKRTFQASSEADAFDHVAHEELMAEEDELAHPVEEHGEEEEEEEDGSGGGGDEQEEEVEGSSEESGDSSLESNNEAIWPLELIDEVVKTTAEDHVDMINIIKQENNSIIHEEGEEDNVGDDNGENPGNLTALPENGLEEPVAGNHWTTRFPRLPIWIWCVLLLLILLSFLVHSSIIRSFARNLAVN